MLEFAGDLGLRRPVRFVHEHFLHLIKEPQIARAAIFVPQPRHHLLQNRQRPTAFVDLVGRQSVAPPNVDGLALPNLLQRNQPLSFASLDRHGMAPIRQLENVSPRQADKNEVALFLCGQLLRSLRSSNNAKKLCVNLRASSIPRLAFSRSNRSAANRRCKVSPKPLRAAGEAPCAARTTLHLVVAKAAMSPCDPGFIELTEVRSLSVGRCDASNKTRKNQASSTEALRDGTCEASPTLSTPVKPGSAKTHIDGVGRDVDIWFDDEQVMERGKFPV